MRKIRPALFGTLPMLVVSVIAGCEYDDSDWQLDQPSGATGPRGGSSSTSGKGTGGKVQAEAGSGSLPDAGEGAAPEGGAMSVGPDYPEPRIDSMEPATGAYGTVVTIKGEGLGNPALKGFTLALGNEGEVVLTPKDTSAVVSWSDDEITFRYPFPAEGAVALTAPKGEVVAGDFAPSWHIAREVEKAPAATVLASISPTPDHIELLFDTMPLTLLDIGPSSEVEHSVAAAAVDPSSVRLYLNATTKKVEGVGVSKDADPVIVHLQNASDDLVGKATAIKLSATEVKVAGGSEGAAVWMKRANGWFRARPSGAGWAQDKGPITDPNEAKPDHESGGTSDGSLFSAYSVDTGNVFDDMEAAYMMKLEPTGTKFGAAVRAGGSVDDYVTGLELRSSGDGLIVRSCGSDMDPFGFSGTDYYCFDSLHAPSGASLLHVPLDQKATTHAFTHERAVATYCSSDRTWLIRTNTDVETAPGEPVGEPVLFPCPEAIALEINGKGDFVPLVRWAGKTYLLERNPAAPKP
jgi:hypothetical protein